MLFLQLALTRADTPSQAICGELAAMAQLEFAYQEEMPVSSFVSRTASCLYDYEPASVLSGPVLMSPSFTSAAAPQAARRATGTAETRTQWP